MLRDTMTMPTLVSLWLDLVIATGFTLSGGRLVLSGSRGRPLNAFPSAKSGEVDNSATC